MVFSTALWILILAFIITLFLFPHSIKNFKVNYIFPLLSANHIIFKKKKVLLQTFCISFLSLILSKGILLMENFGGI